MNVEILSPKNLQKTMSRGIYKSGKEDEGQVTLTLEKEVSPYIVLSCDESFLRTLPGILHFVLSVLSIISLICVCSSGTDVHPFLTLPLSWHSRVFIFVTVTGFMYSFLIILLNVTTVAESFPINWHLLDLIALAVLSFWYLFASSLLASAASYYKELGPVTQVWATEQLIAACVFGYVTCLMYIISSAVALRNLRSAKNQFSAHHLPPPELTPQNSVDL